MLKQNPILFRAILFVSGSLSVGSLLLYFFGTASFFQICLIFSSFEAALLGYLAWWAWSTNWQAAKLSLLAGLFSGMVATLAYDLVRVPLVHSGVPVFKAISYFGTILLGLDRPSAASEFLGWAYHLSNGVSFALMYVALIGDQRLSRLGPIPAVLWGLALEGAMLVTPYAEVLGYQRDLRFLSITVGSHAVYGLVLWAGLRYFERIPPRRRVTTIGATTVAVAAALLAIASDFNRLYGQKISTSPPPYIGPHLYTVWNVPEPDRIAVIWVMKRYVDPDAVFHFIEPFEPFRFGTPLDIPEAEVRRTGTQSATEVLLAGKGLSDAKLKLLGRMAGLSEVSPWMLIADPEAHNLARRIRHRANSVCGSAIHSTCLPAVFDDLDDWHRRGP